MAVLSQILCSHTVGVFTDTGMGTMKYTRNRAFTDLRISCVGYHLAMYSKSRRQESAVTDIGRELIETTRANEN